MGIFKCGKQNGEAAPAEVRVVVLTPGVENGWLTLTGDGLQVRISREDVGILTDREGLAQRFREAEPAVARREWNLESRARFVAMARLMRQEGLTIDRVARILNEPEAEIRSFWGWAITCPGSREDPVLSSLEAAMLKDVVKLIPARVKRSELDNGEFTTSTRLSARAVAGLLRRGSVREAASELGVEPADLEAWISENERLLEEVSR